MKQLLALTAVLLLSGCATWDSMTPQQQQMVIWTTVGGLVVGAIAADDDGNTTIIEQPGHEHDCHFHGRYYC